MPAPTPSDVAARLTTALEIARAAGDIALRYFRSQRFDTQTKADGSPVTTADKEAEEHLRREIERVFPDDAILGEEFGEKAGRSGYRWIIDPIDGTAAFIHGVPLYGVLVGVERELRSVAGVIHMPAMGETAYAAAGQGAFHVAGGGEAKRVQVTRTSVLKEACVCTTGLEYYVRAGRERLLVDVSRACKRLRGWSDCYGHLLVATGHVDAVVDPVMNPWDSAASIIIVEEAGGRYTDFQGNATAHGKDAILSNGLIHEELRAIANAPQR